MSRAVVILNSRHEREKASRWCLTAPSGTRVEFKEAKRSIPQNARMWAMLTDVAQQVQWHGQRLSADDWKVVFLAGLNQEMRIVPNLNGNGFVQLGRSSSDLSKQEMGDLMELIAAFGAQQGVAFHDREQVAA